MYILRCIRERKKLINTIGDSAVLYYEDIFYGAKKSAVISVFGKVGIFVINVPLL